MKIDNTHLLPQLVEFKTNTFYKFVLIIRPKDGNNIIREKQKKEIMIRDWWVSSQEQLDATLPDMITYANLFNARLYMTTDRKSTFKTMTNIQMRMFSIQQQMFSEKNHNVNDYTKAIRKIPSSAASLAESSDKEGKKWLYDIDTKDHSAVEVLVSSLQGYRRVLLPTKSGYHLVVERKYDANKHLRELNLENVDVQKNSLTLIYYNDNKLPLTKSDFETVIGHVVVTDPEMIKKIKGE